MLNFSEFAIVFIVTQAIFWWIRASIAKQAQQGANWALAAALKEKNDD